MNKRRILALLSRMANHEFEASTPEGAVYWKQQWWKFYELAKSKGWPI